MHKVRLHPHSIPAKYVSQLKYVRSSNPSVIHTLVEIISQSQNENPLYAKFTSATASLLQNYEDIRKQPTSIAKHDESPRKKKTMRRIFEQKTKVKKTKN